MIIMLTLISCFLLELNMSYDVDDNNDDSYNHGHFNYMFYAWNIYCLNDTGQCLTLRDAKMLKGVYNAAVRSGKTIRPSPTYFPIATNRGYSHGQLLAQPPATLLVLSPLYRFGPL